MAGRIEEKVVIITGSTKGIGRGIALAVAKEGAKVVVSGRCEKEGREAAEEIKHKFNTDAIFVKCDLSNAEGCKHLIQEAERYFGKIDGLVNNAGIFPYVSLLDTDEEVFDRVFDVNIKAPFFCTKYAIEAMMKNGDGSIVNIGSTHGFGGNGKLAAYACSKGALHTLTQHVARNYARKGIRSNWITVGWVVTPGEMERLVIDGHDKQWLEELGRERVPLGRLQTEEDIANSVLFLLSDESSQVTGVDLHVTGGYAPSSS